MTNPIPEDWHIFMDQYSPMMSVIRQLAKQDWYVREGWTAFLGHYHAGIYLQVFKPHWFNHTGDGIHLETGLTAETLQNRATGIDLHITHKNLFDRDRFNAYATPRMKALVESWPDEIWFKEHTVSERLGLSVRFTKTNFPQQMAAAFTRLSALGPIIDAGLAQL
ncbi:MAG: hypothetical protein K8J31_06905 [Anaerolineae bacterium]|nr:hypothetical protein [Anaerolineae bacterium]